MVRWAFIRHGQSVANAERWLAGQLDSPLTDLGRTEARALRGTLSGYTRLLVSDLSRARETAELAAFGVPVTVEPRLRERTIGDWDGGPRSEVSGKYARILTWDGQPPNGESQRDLARRVLGCLAEHESGEDTIVVCHGGVIRVILGLHEGVPWEEIAYGKIANAVPIELRLPPGRFAALVPPPLPKTVGRSHV